PFESLDHLRQVHSGEAITVVGHEHLFVLNLLAHRPEALADVAPHAGVDHGNPPILTRLAKQLNLGAALRDHAVRIQFRPPVDEEFLGGVGLVAKAQNEVLVPVLTVKIHEMPKNWFVADRDHRLRDAVTIVADARSQAAAEKNHFHVNTDPIKVPLDN